MAVEDALFIRRTVNRLEQLANENRLFEMGKKNEMFDLVRGLKSLSASVELASKNGRAEYALKDMVEKIRNLVSDAEHAICMFTVERKKHTTFVVNCNRGFSGEIQSMRDRVKKIKEDHAQAVQVLIYNHNTPITELAERLGQVVEENVSKEIKKQVEGLVGDIENLDAYLKQAWRSDDNALEDVMKQIRSVVMKAEDAICEYRAEKKHREKKWLRYFESPAYYCGIRDSAKEIKAIRSRIREIKESSTPAAFQVRTYHYHNPTPITDTYEIQLADRLGEVVDENVWLLKEIKKQVDGLVSDIKNLEAYLKQASRNSRSKDNDLVEDMVEKIRNVVIKAEDAICKYTVEKKKHKDKGWWLRCFESRAYYSRITDSAKEIKAIRYRVREIHKYNTAALHHAFMNDHGEAQPAIPLHQDETPSLVVKEELETMGFHEFPAILNFTAVPPPEVEVSLAPPPVENHYKGVRRRP